MAKRPCPAKIPETEDDQVLEDSSEKSGEQDEREFNEQFDDTNQQGTSSYITHFIRHSEDGLSVKELFDRKRQRAQMAGYIDHSQARYYDRYKQQDYTRRNDYMKYCHVCRKKTVGKLRVLPGDLRMRKVWILRSNLDEERSAELWLRELACEGSHGGEFCEAHFPPGSRDMKGNQLMPIDVRPVEGRHSVLEDIQFDFEAIIVQCVFCGRDGALSNMLPFIRNRAKRSRWIDTLSAGSAERKRQLTAALRGGVTQFLCDFHVSDSSFEINGFGEWRLLRNALPDPRLVSSDKRGLRVYLVDKCRDELFWQRELWKNVDQMAQIGNVEEECEEILVEDSLQEYLVQNTVQNAELLEPTEPVTKSEKENEQIILKEEEVHAEEEYSDDSDEENEMIMKLGEVPYSKRLCQVCSAVEPIGAEYPASSTATSPNSTFPYKFSIRTWPFDEFRHKKWLEIMDWPPEFEESMKTLWQKRKTEGSLTDAYHFCPINVCQAHLDFRSLPERMEEWHQTFCILCESCMSDKSLIVPLPADLESRQKWVHHLFPFEESSKFQMKKVSWLRQRLLRAKPTRYRICVYHFSRNSFLVTDDNKIILDTNALPLAIDTDEFDMTPRGPNSVCKCVLCDDWKKVEEMVALRNPSTECERNFLIDTLTQTEKVVVKRALAVLAKTDRTALICNAHFADNMDPFSVIAERRIMYGVQTECVLCAHQNDCTTMIPFPGVHDEKLRTKWINSMCREPWIYRYLATRLEKRGRHYLCSSHFNRSSLRYHPGLGLWRRATATPVLACTTEEERQKVWDLSKSQPMYHPLILEVFDNEGCGPLDYDDVAHFLGKHRMNQIESELNNHGRADATRERRERRKKMQPLIGRGFYDDMPDIFGPEDVMEACEEDVEEEVEDGEIVQEECIIYQDEHQLEEVEEQLVVEHGQVADE